MASACCCTKHLSKGRPPWPENHGDCGSNLPRPRNSSVPPRRPFKTAGSSPKGVPVRFWLDGRAATRRTFKAILQGFSRPGAVPGANPTVGVRGPGVSAASRTRGPQPSRAADARPKLAPVRPPAPRHGPALAHGGEGWPPSLRGGQPSPPLCLLRGEETSGVEDLLLAQQVIDGPAQAGGESTQGPRLAVLLLAAG
jgi:hypothetical protein